MVTKNFRILLAHSKNELMRSAAMARRLSSVCVCVCVCVCLSVNFFRGNRYYDAKNGSIATKLAQDGQHVVAHLGCAQGRGQGQRSRDTGAFVPITKIASCRRQMAGLQPNLHTMVPQVRLHPGCAQGQGQRQRSRDTGNLVPDLKSLFLAGKLLD